MQNTGLLHPLFVLLIFSISSTFSIAGHATDKTLKILIWEEYLAPEIIKLWQQKTGITLEQIYYDNENNRDVLISNGKSYDIDLVVLGSTTAHLFEKTKHIQPIDKSILTSNNRHNTNWRQQCGTYATPYLWGTLGIVYRTDKFNKPPSSWQELLSPDAALKGHIGMINNYVDTLAPSLLMRNASISTDDKPLLKQAFNELVEQLPSVLTYEYPISFLKSNAKADQLYMALAYSGDEVALNEISNTQRWHYIIPNEGTLIWVDCIAIMANANQKPAIQFIEFLNQPEIAALNAEWNNVATTNDSALPLLSHEFINNKIVFPGVKIRQNAQKYSPLTKENMLQRNRIVSALLIRHDTL